MGVGDRAGEGSTYINLGNAYHSISNFKEAVECHSKALCTAKEVGDRGLEGRAYANLGNDLDSLGDSQQAIEHHKNHLSVAKEVGNKAESKGLVEPSR